jgi:hypothetical protein
LSPLDRNEFTDISSYVDTIMSIVDPNKYPPVENPGTQTIGLGLNLTLNFDSEDVDTLELGGLLENFIADMIVNAKTTSAFNDGLAARISLRADLGALNLSALLKGDQYNALGTAAGKQEIAAGSEVYILVDGAYVAYDGTNQAHVSYVANGGTVYEKISALTSFIQGSDLDTIELALELLKTDEKGNVLRTDDGGFVPMAGIYLHQGDLYLDGTSLFNVASNYTKIPNFVDMLMGLIFGDGANATASSMGDGEALASADVEADVERNAVLALVMSDTSMQILLTKSIISLVVGALLPDIGSIEEIFNKLELSVGFETGKYSYAKFFDDGDEVDELVAYARESDNGNHDTSTGTAGGDHRESCTPHRYPGSGRSVQYHRLRRAYGIQDQRQAEG